MKRNQFINAKGEIIDTDSDIVPDGCGISTKMMMLDGLDDTQREIARSFSRPAQITDALGRANQPGFRLMDAASSEAAEGTRAIRKRKLSDAWRGSVPLGPDEYEEGYVDPASGNFYTKQEAGEAANDSLEMYRTRTREAYRKRTCDAWRQPMTDGAAATRAHAAALHSMAADLEQTAEEETGEDAKRASAFQKKWTGAFEADDGLPDHPAPDSETEYQAAKVAASNRWRSPAGRIGPKEGDVTEFSPEEIRYAMRMANVLGIAPPRTATPSPLWENTEAGANIERQIAARKSHDAVTDSAFAEYEKRQTQAWMRTP